MKKSARCAGCGKTAAMDDSNPWRPFCSERCKTLDLGAWFGGSYSIPADPLDDMDLDELPSEPPPGARYQ